MYEPQEDSILLINCVNKFLKHQNEHESKHKNIMLALDMGTGSGIQAFNLAQHAEQVVAVDINEEEVEFVKDEAQSQKVHNIKVLRSDLFKEIPLEYQKKFDLIVFNPPYLPREEDEKEDPELTSGTSGIHITKRFLEEAKPFLKEQGTIFFVASSLSNMEGLEQHLEEQGYEFKVVGKEHIMFEDILIYEAKIKKKK